MPTQQIEPDFACALTGPEIELLEVVRLAHMSSFALAIRHQHGVFTVKLTDLNTGRFLEANGATFEACWRGLAGSDLQALDLQERMAGRGLRVVDPLTVLNGGKQ